MSSVIRSLVVKVGADISGFQKNMAQVSKDFGKIGKNISSAGDTLTKGLSVPILGAVAGLAGLAISAGKGADELITMANKTGITTQALQEMEYAARFIDVEVETMTGSMQKLTKNMDMARRGTKEQEDAFKALGIEYKNQDGSLRNAKDVWAEAIDALKNVSSEADRDALAMNIFGKSAVELNPLIKAGSEELKRLGEEAHIVGAVMSDENVTALGKFDDSMQRIQAVVKTAGAELGAAFLPMLEKLMPVIVEKIVPAIQSFAGFIGGLIDKFNSMSPQMQGFILAIGGIIVAIGPFLSIAGTVVTAISGITATFAAVSAVIAGGGGVIAALGALLGPVGIVLVVIAALAAVAFLIIKNWEPISKFFINLWESVSIWTVTAWDKIKKFFSDTWTNLKEFFGKWGPEILTVIVPFIGVPLLIIKHWDKIKEFFSALPGKIADFFTELPEKMLGIGSGIVSGLWSGIREKITWLKDKITGFASGIVSGIKNAMGIKSPSKVMADQVGKWIPAGIGKGITDNKKLVDAAMSGLSADMSINATMAGQATAAQTSSQPVIQLVFNSPIYGMLDFEQKVKQTVKDAARSGAFRGVLTNA